MFVQRCVTILCFVAGAIAAGAGKHQNLIRRELGLEEPEEQSMEQAYVVLQGLPDPELEGRACLPEIVDAATTAVPDFEDLVCSDKPANKFKDDSGNYIRYTKNEDKLSLKIWDHVMSDCRAGKTYLKDIVEGFASGGDCFTSETCTDHTNIGTCMADKPWWSTKEVKLENGKVNLDPTAKGSKKICEGDEQTAPAGKFISNSAALKERQAGIMGLVNRFNEAKKDQPADLIKICPLLFSAHADLQYWVRGVLVSSRPFVCNENKGNHTTCAEAEKWYMRFLNRDMFAIKVYGVDDKGDEIIGKKGRAADSKNTHSGECNQKFIEKKTNKKNAKWFQYFTNRIGTTAEECAIDVQASQEILPPPSTTNLKGGVQKNSMWGVVMSDDLIAKHFMYCSAPFLAGISGSIPQYMLMAAGSPAKQGKGFGDALTNQELLTLVAMLELAGFHTLTELVMAVNHYLQAGKRKILVTPPFDSGDYSPWERKHLNGICSHFKDILKKTPSENECNGFKDCEWAEGECYAKAECPHLKHVMTKAAPEIQKNECNSFKDCEWVERPTTAGPIEGECFAKATKTTHDLRCNDPDGCCNTPDKIDENGVKVYKHGAYDEMMKKFNEWVDDAWRMEPTTK